MGIALNQADLSKKVGTLALAPSNAQPQAKLGASQTGLVAGTFVKASGTADGLLEVVAGGATDVIIGCIAYSPLKASYSTGDMVALAKAGDVVNLLAKGSISANAEVVIATGGIVAYTAPEQGETAKTKVGVALSGASSGDIIKVQLL